MPIVGSYILPHPPLCVPEVGKGREKDAEKTISAMLLVCKQIAELKPDVIVFISPHAEAYTDYFPIADGEIGIGSLAKYGAPSVSFRIFYDSDMTKEIISAAKDKGLQAGTSADNERYLDHGTMVPLYYIHRYYRDFKAVRLGLSGFSLLEHYRYGQMLGELFQKNEKKIVIIASGDLSHCHRVDSPYGFRPEGPRYDEIILKIIKTSNFDGLLSMNRSMLTEARECGHRAIMVLVGMMDRTSAKGTVLSHEAPFGVGYLVASFQMIGYDPSRAFYELYCSREEFAVREHIDKSDIYVKWARAAIETYIKTKKIPPVSKMLPDNFLKTASGVFVTLHKYGELRGCLGSVKPLRKNLGLEIAYNAISAAVHDPRFEPVTEKDFPYLRITVDVLTNPLPILSIMDLDANKYGVIVEAGEKRGVILPNLPGIDTPDKQIEIARQKAGIDPADDINLYRFETTRHR